MPKVVKYGSMLVAGLVVLALVAATALTFYFIRRPLPAHSGQRIVDGLTAPVDILRDELGIPQIYADTATDLFFAQGYVHAQERFFEMDYRRHVTSGRISELVGANEDALLADRTIRTMGWRHVAEEEWGLLDLTTKSYLQAYADGVNAYLEGRDPDALSIEYTLLGLQVKVTDPEPWTPIDSLAWLKAMAWDLRSNYDDELGRAELWRVLRSEEAVNEIYPPYIDAHRPILPAVDQQFQAHTNGVGTPPGSTPTPDPSAPPSPSPDPDGRIEDPAATDPAGSEPAGSEPAGTDSAAPEPSASASPTIYDDPGVIEALAATSTALAAVPELIGGGSGIGSNSWVISGAFTETGAPILANDPHLTGTIPGIWLQMGLHCRTVSSACPFDVAGFTFSGFPGVIIGHNADLAWGFTNMGADVADFYLEHITADGNYIKDKQLLPLQTRTEEIKVNGGESVTITVRSTDHGPIISDVSTAAFGAGLAPAPPDGGKVRYDVSLQWTALMPSKTAAAVFTLNTAKNPQDIAAAAAAFAVPAQNIVFATTGGTIGYQAPGLIPIRLDVPGAVVPSNGTWPKPGWDSRYDWQGFIPAHEMPAVIDPPEGFIVAANQQVQPVGAGPFLAVDWNYGYRSERIRTLIEQAIAGASPITLEQSNEWHMDAHEPAADLLMPYVNAMTFTDPYLAEPWRMLTEWDRQLDADSPAAALWSVFYSKLLAATFGDELPSNLAPDGGSRWLAVLTNLITQEDSRWWDDRRTVNIVENRNEVIQEAFVDARKELTMAISKNPQDWAWGKLHTLTLEHSVLGGESVPGPVRWLMNPRPVGASGGSNSVNANAWAADEGFVVTSLPSMRMVIDLSDFDNSTWVNLTGTSGHAGSVHYTDQIQAWIDGDTYPWPFSMEAVQAATKKTLVLRPPN